MGGIEMQRDVITLDDILREAFIQKNHKSKVNPLFYAANMSEIYH